MKNERVRERARLIRVISFGLIAPSSDPTPSRTLHQYDTKRSPLRDRPSIGLRFHKRARGCERYCIPAKIVIVGFFLSSIMQSQGSLLPVTYDTHTHIVHVMITQKQPPFIVRLASQKTRKRRNGGSAVSA
jgi:hypothetical protein